MKTLAALLAATGLAYVGLAPDSGPAPRPEPPYRGEYRPQPAPPPPEDPFARVLQQPGPVLPFDVTRPIVVRIPPGYDDFPAGDVTLSPEGQGFWHLAGAKRGGFSLHVGQFTKGGVTSANFYLINDKEGNAVYPGADGKMHGTSIGFGCSGGIAADGTFTPSVGILVRFPAAQGPWRAFQP